MENEQPGCLHQVKCQAAVRGKVYRVQMRESSAAAALEAICHLTRCMELMSFAKAFLKMHLHSKSSGHVRDLSSLRYRAWLRILWHGDQGPIHGLEVARSAHKPLGGSLAC